MGIYIVIAEVKPGDTSRRSTHGNRCGKSSRGNSPG